MSKDDPVAVQYDRWVYPEPIDDLVAWTRAGHRQAADPQLMATRFWPECGYRDGLDILVAGCGANQAAAMAYTNPAASVTGIDISPGSLAHERALSRRHHLSNLQLQELPVEQAAELDRRFDLVVATGVLHHLRDPATGLRALAGALKPDGVIFIMLYARYGRAGAYMLQEFFRRVGLDQSAEDVALVRATLDTLGSGHPARMAGADSPDHRYDAGLVDLYLHRRDVAYTVSDCLQLVADAGLVFQDWYTRSHYYPESQVPTTHPLSQRLQALDEPDLWSAMELFNGTITKHAFFACGPQRAVRTAPITPETVFDLVPSLAAGVSFSPPTAAGPATLTRAGQAPVTLNPGQSGLLSQVNGRRSVGECVESGQLSGEPQMLLDFATQLIRSLWRSDYLDVRAKA